MKIILFFQEKSGLFNEIKRFGIFRNLAEFVVLS
jgi:hypothetical protein